MNVRKSLQVQLDDDSFTRLEQGEPLQIPVDGETDIVIYPPQYQNGGEGQ